MAAGPAVGERVFGQIGVPLSFSRIGSSHRAVATKILDLGVVSAVPIDRLDPRHSFSSPADPAPDHRVQVDLSDRRCIYTVG